MGKHFILDNTEESFSYRQDEEKVATEAALDGFYVIRTSVPEDLPSSEAAFTRICRKSSGLYQAYRPEI